ncbi:hypothetical protein Dcar01_00454 [Deinococcus carri]|uniref:Pili assembly chaperone N-terminal domain-containing protein n=1 Tax=Deinococcus carri TaxID=1211323 RepID=A0ABP9W319_9DEIO
MSVPSTLRRLLPLALALTAAASAQAVVKLSPPATSLYAGQPADLTLIFRNTGKTPVMLGNVLKDGSMPCLLFRVFDRAGGPPLITDWATANCAVRERVTLASGQKAVYRVQLSLALPPGEYTAIMTVPTEPKAQHVQTTLRVGPGPLVAELRIPLNVKAGALPLDIVLHNVWRTPERPPLLSCGVGLLIRNANGRSVYDSRPEHLGCKPEAHLGTVQPGSALVMRWHEEIKLPPGRYTAVMWGEYNASVRF